ncbi:MAG: PIG-L family deacetylase [Bryobacterales bacterium]|nr:PIG-L family deacetylase [Bryobacterales bacterium]
MQRREFVAGAWLAAGIPAGGLRMQAAAAAPAPARVLAVSAHPADFCSRAGGTLIKHVRAGARAKVIWLTQGESDESAFLIRQRPGISVDEVRRIREKEAFACAEVIGAEGRMFGFGDGPLRMTPERMELLAREIADFKPSLILTHWKDELTYPTHWRTAVSVIEAAQMARASWDIRFFEPNLGTASRVGFVPDHYVDIGEVFERKIEALKTLAAQPALVPNYTVCNRWRGLECGRQYAEAFVRWAPKPPVHDLLGG